MSAKGKKKEIEESRTKIAFVEVFCYGRCTETFRLADFGAGSKICHLTPERGWLE